VHADTDVEARGAEIATLIADNRADIVAVGEVGLEYYRLEGDVELVKSKQREMFVKMIEIANLHKLPVVIHSREAFDDTFQILLRCTPKYNFVFHCFSENLPRANALLEAFPNCFIGLAGMLTYKKSDELREVASTLNVSNLLLETDAPFLAPQLVRGQTNEPAFVRHTFDFFSTLRGESKSALESILTENARRFYLSHSPRG